MSPRFTCMFLFRIFEIQGYEEKATFVMAVGVYVGFPTSSWVAIASDGNTGV